MSSYAELHCHSAFSLLDGASTPEALVRRAVELGIVALALTDHDDLGGIVRFSQTARDVGLEAIVGAELTVSAAEADAPLSHITLLARTAEGYANLSELVTRARMDEAPAASGKWAPNRGRPRVGWDDLAELGGGLMALTGCPQGELARRVRAGDGKGARELLDYLRGVYDGYVAVEIWDHALPEERELADRLLELADRRRLPAVATNDVHYATPSGRIVHDVLTCLRHRVTLDEAGTRLRPNGEWYLKPASVVWRRWQRRPDVVENTLAVAAECAFRLADLSPAMPGFQVPSGMTRQGFLESLVWKGALERYSGVAGQRQNGDPIRVAEPNGTEAPGESPRFTSRVRSGTAEPPRFRSRVTVGSGECPRFMSRRVRPESSTGPGAPNVRSGSSAVPSLRDPAADPRTASSPRTAGCDQDVAGDPRPDHSPLKRGRGRDAAADPSRKGGGGGCHERTFGAPRPVFHSDPTQRDMKRGHPPPPTNARENGKSKLTQDVRRQIRHELEVIERMDLAGYFLTVWDIVRFARRRGILLQGRGSAANSCVCYCLGITAVDPIKFELLFERFLSEERGGAPDIDLDIEHERREEVLQYVYEKYTRGHAAMVCEAITYRGRSAVRDAARVLGFSTDVADGLASEADRREAADAADALEGGGLTACGLDPSDRRVQALVHVVRGLDQLPRHRSIHVGGFVLTEGELSQVVPIEPAAMKDRTVIQWDKDDLEFAGLIKIDLLGLGMLTCLAKAIRYIRETRGVTIDLAGLPAVDREVYKMIQEADTVGVFQVESRAQMNSLPRLKPEAFYDLVVQVALIRPGPIQGDMVHPYVRRRRGEEPVTYLHPDLEPILKRTLGVPLFQEQGMKVAVAMAGFTPGQADALRRAMGFKRSKEAMALIEPALRSGMTERGIAQDVQDQIVKQLTAFANYGFPESHSASFALLVYASAYLKRYYAPEFFCGLLNSQPMGFYSPGTLVQDARRHGVEVRPVDLARSHWDCTLEPADVLPRRESTAEQSPRDGGDGRDAVADASPRKGGSGECHERTFGAPKTVLDSDPTQHHQDAADGPRVDPSPRKGECGRCHERTFGAPGPLPCSGPTQRDMKRGHLPHSTVPRDMKRGHAPYPTNHRHMKREASPAPALRVGLRYVRGLGREAQERLQAAWEAGGPFESVEDVVRRSGLGLPALKTLAEAGAFDTLWGPGRRSALWEVLARLADKPLAPVEPAADQPPGPEAPHQDRRPKLREMSKIEMVAADYMTTGLCTHGHPMEHLRATLRENGVLSAEQLSSVRSGERVKVAGVVICRQRPGTAKGVCFITLEDETGFSNFVVYADLFQRYRRTIVRSPVLLIEGIAQNEQDVVNVQARRISAIAPRAGAEAIESHDFH